MKAKYIENRHAVLFDCPGCSCMHMVWIKQPEGINYPIWGVKNDLEHPTITPSVLVNGNMQFHNPTVPRCHSFVTEGKIQFLNDCTHLLAGQTIELPDMD